MTRSTPLSTSPLPAAATKAVCIDLQKELREIIKAEMSRAYKDGANIAELEQDGVLTLSLSIRCVDVTDTPRWIFALPLYRDASGSIPFRICGCNSEYSALLTAENQLQFN